MEMVLIDDMVCVLALLRDAMLRHVASWGDRIPHGAKIQATSPGLSSRRTSEKSPGRSNANMGVVAGSSDIQRTTAPPLCAASLADATSPHRHRPNRFHFPFHCGGKTTDMSDFRRRRGVRSR
jgi:hypothetical protein